MIKDGFAILVVCWCIGTIHSATYYLLFILSLSEYVSRVSRAKRDMFGRSYKMSV